jgi:hypothetical protein
MKRKHLSKYMILSLPLSLLLVLGMTTNAQAWDGLGGWNSVNGSSDISDLVVEYDT